MSRPTSRSGPGDVRLPVSPNWLAYGGERTDADRVMDEITHTTRPVPAEWLEALARSDAELDAGLTVPAEVVHRRLRDCIGRIEEKRAGAVNHEASPAVD